MLISRSRLRFYTWLFFLTCPAHALADKLRITSNPPGATVEIDGVARGTTPFKEIIPAISTKRGRPLARGWNIPWRVSLAGSTTKELTLTEGPMEWVSLNGKSHGDYWLLKSSHFEVELQPFSETFTGGISANVSGITSSFRPALSWEEVVRQAKPAVVYLKGLDKAGLGFLSRERA